PWLERPESEHPQEDVVSRAAGHRKAILDVAVKALNDPEVESWVSPRQGLRVSLRGTGLGRQEIVACLRNLHCLRRREDRQDLALAEHVIVLDLNGSGERKPEGETIGRGC